VENFIKLISAAVHELSWKQRGKNFATMPKTMLPFLPRPVINGTSLQWSVVGWTSVSCNLCGVHVVRSSRSKISPD